MNFLMKSLSQTILVVLFIASTSCTCPDNKSADPDTTRSELLVIEAESMELTAAEIIPAEEASSGKAIKMLSEEAKAMTELTLPKGQYLMNAVLNSPDEHKDGFYLFVNDEIKRTNNYHFNKWVYGFKFIIFESDGTTPIQVGVSSSWEGQIGKEYGMLIDCFEIIELCSSADVLDRWSK